MKRIVVFTGSGVSAESGIKTFRDSGGLWEEYRIEDVATPQAWQRDQALVLDFYNQRRRQVLDAKPNAAHVAIAELQKKYDVQVITQNIDDLHERAGSKNVLHLHGEIRKSRSTLNPSLVYDVEGTELIIGEKCTLGSQLRPHIVWFGEQVPMMDAAVSLTETADIFIVIGTSLQVYPAAGLISHAPYNAVMYLIDPNAAKIPYLPNITIIKELAGTGVPALVGELLKNSKGKKGIGK
jgi:NAD-dependent deacetylase